jgi:hypothetical protein
MTAHAAPGATAAHGSPVDGAHLHGSQADIGTGSDRGSHGGGNGVEFPIAHRPRDGRAGRPGRRTNPSGPARERTRRPGAAVISERTRDPQGCWAFPVALAQINPPRGTSAGPRPQLRPLPTRLAACPPAARGLPVVRDTDSHGRMDPPNMRLMDHG